MRFDSAQSIGSQSGQDRFWVFLVFCSVLMLVLHNAPTRIVGIVLGETEARGKPQNRA